MPMTKAFNAIGIGIVMSLIAILLARKKLMLDSLTTKVIFYAAVMLAFFLSVRFFFD
jgi:hypothetical protein